MNKTKIEWADYTWNPITGNRTALHPKYSRMSGDVRWNKARKDQYRKEGNLFLLDHPFKDENGTTLYHPFGDELTFHRYRLNDLEQLPSGKNIIVCSTADLFGPDIPDEYIREIISICRENPIHNYLLITDYPERVYKFVEREDTNLWIGSEKMEKIFAVPFFIKKFLIFNEKPKRDYNLTEVGTVDWFVANYKADDYKEFESVLPVFVVGGSRKEFPEQLIKKKMGSKSEKKLITNCYVCGQKKYKRDMYSVTIKKGRNGTNKTVGYVCEDCLDKFLDKITGEKDESE